MKIGYIVALLMVALMIGCAAPETPPAEEPAAVPPEAPAEEAPVEEVEEPAEEAPAEEMMDEGAADMSDADQATVDRLKAACERGNAGICAALKNRYGIDWPPAEVEEPVEPTE